MKERVEEDKEQKRREIHTSESEMSERTGRRTLKK